MYNHSDNSCVPWSEDVLFRLLRPIFLLRVKEQRVIVVAPKYLLIKSPLEVACAGQNFINEESKSLCGTGIRFHGIVWGL